MDIEILYFDECPNHHVALSRLNEVIGETKQKANVQLVNIRSDEEAKKHLFLGSPTIRVNGIDIDTNALGRTDFGRKCRIYRVNGEIEGSPAKPMIKKALEGVAGVTVDVDLIVASWCPICPSAKELWRELQKLYRFKYEEIDIDSNAGRKLVAQYNVLSVPTTIIEGKVAFIGKPDRAAAVELLKAQCPWCFTGLPNEARG